MKKLYTMLLLVLSHSVLQVVVIGWTYHRVTK